VQERNQKDVDMRGLVAAYVGDQYLLGRSGEARRALDSALRRGDLGRGGESLGMRKWGYIRSGG
jgi:hypothetical protein